MQGARLAACVVHLLRYQLPLEDRRAALTADLFGLKPCDAIRRALS